jgi:hypothetical protein
MFSQGHAFEGEARKIGTIKLGLEPGKRSPVETLNLEPDHFYEALAAAPRREPPLSQVTGRRTKPGDMTVAGEWRCGVFFGWTGFGASRALSSERRAGFPG